MDGGGVLDLDADEWKLEMAAAIGIESAVGAVLYKQVRFSPFPVLIFSCRFAKAR